MAVDWNLKFHFSFFTYAHSPYGWNYIIANMCSICKEGICGRHKWNIEILFVVKNSGKTVMSYRLLCHYMSDGYLVIQLGKPEFVLLNNHVNQIFNMNFHSIQT